MRDAVACDRGHPSEPEPPRPDDIPDSELGRHGQPRLNPMPWPEVPEVSMMGSQQLPGRAEASLLMFSIDRPLENSSCNSDARI